MHCNHLPSPSLCKVCGGPPGTGFGGGKAPNSMGRVSIAGVLRLRAPSAVSRDPSVRRCAQDDDSVGELTERRPLGWRRGAPQIPRLPSDFLSGLVASVNFMRLSLKKAAYVAVYESREVGNPGSLPRHAGAGGMTKWRAVTFIRGRQIGWTEKKQHGPSLRSKVTIFV
jgi:hypothetical protein